MRFAGIDIASETHVVAVVDEASERRCEADELRRGRRRVREAVRAARRSRATLLVAMEATGHYWQNLFAALAAAGSAVALLNPLRTRRFAGEDLQRTKTDAIDALGIARFAAQKRPMATRLPDGATEELRELVRLRDRLDAGLRGPRPAAAPARRPRLPRVHPPRPQSRQRAGDRHPARATRPPRPSSGCPGNASPISSYDGRHKVGQELAKELIEAAKVSVGRTTAPPTASRSATPARTSTCFVAGSASWTPTSSASSATTRSARCSRPSTASAQRPPPGSSPSSGTSAPSRARPPWPPTSARPRPAPVRQAGGHARRPHAARKRRAAGQALDANADRRPQERLAPRLLPRPPRAREAPKVALVAAMRKLLHAVYAVARDRKPFTPKLAGPPV